jgi:hypothetical protein
LDQKREAAVAESVSARIIKSGLAAQAFGGALEAPIDEYTFRVSRDGRKLWLNAKRRGGEQSVILHEPPAVVGQAHVKLTKQQWELAVSVAS